MRVRARPTIADTDFCCLAEFAQLDVLQDAMEEI